MSAGGHREHAPLAQLLQPSLSRSEPTPPLYSVQAGFMVAFLGGGFASVLFTGLNVKRLGRMSRELPMLLSGFVFFALLQVAVGHVRTTGLPLPLAELLEDNPRMVRYALRFLSMGFFGLTYLRLRRFYKAAQFAGQDPPGPWLPGIACAGASTGITLLFAFLGTLLGTSLGASP